MLYSISRRMLPGLYAATADPGPALVCKGGMSVSVHGIKYPFLMCFGFPCMASPTDLHIHTTQHNVHTYVFLRTGYPHPPPPQIPLNTPPSLSQGRTTGKKGNLNLFFIVTHVSRISIQTASWHIIGGGGETRTGPEASLLFLYGWGEGMELELEWNGTESWWTECASIYVCVPHCLTHLAVVVRS